MKRTFVAGLLFVALLTIPSVGRSATWYVPDDFVTIQAALDGAAAGDEIIVRDGTYTGTGNKNLDFVGKALTLRSENGPESTIIDCEGSGRGFQFQIGETPATVVDGFSVINGGGLSQGGGMYVVASNPTIANMIISNNSASSGGGLFLWYLYRPPAIKNVTVSDNSATNGGGIYITDSFYVVIENCTISGNIASGDGGGIYEWFNSHMRINNSTIVGNSADTGNGGGIYNFSWDTVITGSTVSGNSSELSGGGIYIETSSQETDIESCTISDNSAGRYGGGIYHRGSTGWSSYLTNSTISGNSAGGSGGGLYLFSALTVTNSVFAQNAAGGGGGIYVDGDGGMSNLVMEDSTVRDNASPPWWGGGIFFHDSRGTITDSTITGNSSSEWGGGVFGEFSSQLTLTHCTFGSNVTTSRGGALYWRGGGEVTASNCVFWGDSAPEGPEIGLEALMTVSYSDVEAGEAAIYDPASKLTWGAGNIDADPLFVGGGDYHLTALSPCIDTGTDAGVYTDIDGDTRPLGGGYDMGSDEYPVELARIWLKAPEDASPLTAPPTFSWTPHGGTTHAFAVDLALSPSGPIYSTYDTLHQIISATTWTMPTPIWNKIPAGKQVYWRVRGVDLDVTPLTVVTSDEVWSFYKQ